jgi:hypothetical protein
LDSREEIGQNLCSLSPQEIELLSRLERRIKVSHYQAHDIAFAL